MASPNIYSRTKGRDFTNTENPLDRAIGDFEIDDPIRPTLRQWGWFPFLYESVDSFDIGGDGGILFAGGDYGVPSIDLWQFPNAEQFAGLQVPTPTAPAEGEDLTKNLCTDETVKSGTIREVCLPLAKADGCLELKTILPSFTDTLSLDILNVQFPGGGTMDIQTTIFCQDPNGPIIGRRLKLTVRRPGQSTISCSAVYGTNVTHAICPVVDCVAEGCFNEPGAFSKAMAHVLKCMKDNFGATYSGLGC